MQHLPTPVPFSVQHLSTPVPFSVLQLLKQLLVPMPQSYASECRPVQSEPVQSELVQSEPVQSELVQSEPVQSELWTASGFPNLANQQSSFFR